MRDSEIIAKEVSVHMRKHHPVTFDQAFASIMRQYPRIRGKAWSETKSEVGKILQANKKQLKKKVPHRKNVRSQPTDCMETLPLDFG